MTERPKGFPFILIFPIFFFYTAFQVYEFHLMEDGDVAKHQASIAGLHSEIDGLKRKLTEGQKFLKSLEDKKLDLQAQVRRLSEYQGALSEAPDVPNLIKTLITEAKQIDLTVSRIEPGRKMQKEYYLEQEFRVEVRGSYQQITLFAQRVSRLQRILRIEAWTIKPLATGSASKNYLKLVGDLSVRAYQYTISKEDTIGKTAAAGGLK